MKKKLIFLLLICTFMVVLAVAVHAVTDVKPTIVLDNGIEITPVDNKFYLPAYADVTKLKFNFGASYDAITYDGNTVASGAILDVSSHAETDKVSGSMRYYKIKFKGSGENLSQTISIYKASTLPSVHISTSIGSSLMIGSNVTDSNAGVKLVDSDGTLLVGQDVSEVRTRGNTTPTMLKKPFQIKFEQKINVLGMGKAKTWLLLANYLDQSYIRNSVMYKLAKDMGMGASDFTNVDVYVDGEYQGVYLLCEKVNVNKNRVNITELEDLNDALNPSYGSTTTVTSGSFIDSTIISEYKYVNNVVNPDDITGGYLIELDNNNKGNRSSFGSYFMTKTEFGENLYVIKSPEYCSKEQVEYIAKLFSEMEEAMASSNGKNSLGRHYTEYIDVESWAVAYIMAEYGRNYDAGGASIYFNKDVDKNGEVSKIVKGPLWDCDNTLGNIRIRGDADNQYTMWAANRTPWNMLTRHDDFNALVKEKYEIAYNLVYDYLDYGGFITEQLNELGDSPHLDRLRWESYDDSKWPLYADGSMHWWERYGDDHFHAFRYYRDGKNDNKDTAVGYLCVIMSERAEYLADTWEIDSPRRQRLYIDDVIDDEPIPGPDPEPDPAPEPEPTPPEESSSSTDSESTTESSSTVSVDQNDSSDTPIPPSSSDEQSSSSSSESDSSDDLPTVDDENEEDLNFFERIIQAIANFFKKLFDGLFGMDSGE